MDVTLRICVIFVIVTISEISTIKIRTSESDTVVDREELEGFFKVECEIDFEDTDKRQARYRWRKMQDIKMAKRGIDYSNVAFEEDSWQMSNREQTDLPFNTITGEVGWPDGEQAFYDKFVVEVEELSQDPYRIKYTMTVNDVQVEDSGAYICEAGIQSDPKTVHHYVHIFQKAEEINMFSMYNQEERWERPSDNFFEQQSEIIFYEDTDGYFECQAMFGNPAPRLEVDIDGERIDGLKHNETITRFGTNFQNQRITYTVAAYTDKFRPRMKEKKEEEDEEEQMIRCVAKVDKTKDGEHDDKYTMEKELPLVAYYKPRFDCPKEQKLPKGVEQASISCKLYSRPELDKVTWNTKNNGQSVSRIQSQDGYDRDDNYKLQAILQTGEESDESLVRLMFDVVEEKHYDLQYEVTAENNVGSQTIIITIKDGEVEVRDSAPSVCASCLLLMLTSLLVIFTS